MRKYVLGLLLACILLLLAACAVPEEQTADVIENPVSVETPKETEIMEESRAPAVEPQMDDLTGFLAELRGEEISGITESELYERREATSPEKMAGLLNAAAGHVVEAPTAASQWIGIWTMNVTAAEERLILNAGLPENLIQIIGEKESVWLEDEDLYWLIRTMNDTPDAGIDQKAYEKYKDVLLACTAPFDQLPDGFSKENVTKEIIGFQQTHVSEKLNAKAYRIDMVTTVKPEAKTPCFLAGGAYIDSQMRVHGNHADTYQYLIVVDDQPIGFAGWTFGTEGFDRYETREALLAENFGDHVTFNAVRNLEIGLVNNGFTFRDSSELDEERLYLLFLMVADYSELEAYYDQETALYFFDRETIVSVLTDFFKAVNFDITAHPDYDPEANAIVTPVASGFGGNRNMKLLSWEVEGTTQTFTVSFHEDIHYEDEPYMTKTYTIEFYDGGYYFVSALVV